MEHGAENRPDEAGRSPHAEQQEVEVLDARAAERDLEGGGGLGGFEAAHEPGHALEAARDLGASPFHAFRLVTLPLSTPAILAGVVIIALPMFGDYYTPDLLSGAPQTSLIGNQINLYIRGGQQVPVGAALVVVLMVFLTVLMGYYLFATARAQRRLGG